MGKKEYDNCLCGQRSHSDYRLALRTLVGTFWYFKGALGYKEIFWSTLCKKSSNVFRGVGIPSTLN